MNHYGLGLQWVKEGGREEKPRRKNEMIVCSNQK
jgi:hypothetical protein